MTELLKDRFGPDVPERIADAIARVWPSFGREAFLREALHGYADLELVARVRHIASALYAHLPADYDEAIRILMASLGPRTASAQESGMASFFYAPHVFFVADHGLDHWETSMAAQYELTQRFTAEFSIRAFLEHVPERTLARLHVWTTDPSEDVRRLVSEGTRPRLPWAPRLGRFQLDPSPVLELLERLKDDPSLYVRRSVANNLNDIGKDHPDVLVATCRRWLDGASSDRRWLIKHALRSAIKRGEPAALALLGYDGASVVAISAVSIVPPEPRIGDTVSVRFAVRNDGRVRAALNIDLLVHFVKATGKTSSKVFKVREAELAPADRIVVAKSISLRQHTTRTHYPGTHRVEAVVNGVATPVGAFELR